MTEATVRIAYLVICHRDPVHVARLAIKLTREDRECAVFVHVDGKSDMMATLADLVRDNARIMLLTRQVDVYWCGYSQIEASYELLRAACRHGDFDRFVILQGADYPIKSAGAIRALFLRHPDREFLRACDTTIARTRHLCAKSRYILVMDRPNILKKAWNRLTNLLDLKIRRGSIVVDGRRWHLYWGAAQIAFTRQMADLFLDYENHPALTRRFRTSFGPEETWFHTIAFNSALRANTTDAAPIPETPDIRLADTRSIAYFEYRVIVRVWAEADFELLRQVDEPFIRKVNSEVSTALLDRIDTLHGAGVG